MWLKFTITLLIGAVCGYFAVRDVHFANVYEHLQTANWWLIAAGFVPMFFSHVFRTLRWQTIISPMQKTQFGKLFAINAVGFLTVSILPLRLGEFTRPLLLTQHYQLAYSTALATCAVERIFDGIAVLIVLIIGLTLAPISVTTIPYLNWEIASLIKLALITFLPILAILFALVFFQAATIKLIQYLLGWLPQKWQVLATKIFNNFITGLSALIGVKRSLLVLLYSLLIWGSITVVTYWTIIAFPMQLPFVSSFTVLGIICLGIMLPGPPGFAGNYELFCKAALALFAIESNLAIGFALTSHLFSLVFMLFFGALCYPKAPIKFSLTKSVN